MNKFSKIVSVVTLLLSILTGVALSAYQVFFYYTDPAGTPLAMSDASGTVVWRADYLPFGEESIGTQTIQNNKMFVGKEKDSESGLYYFGARYMDAAVGRFVAIDPIGPVDPMSGRLSIKMLANPQRLNRYAYGLNNPIKYIDTDGNWTEEVHNAMIDKAFGGVLSSDAIKAIKQAGKDLDSLWHQNSDNQYEHAMRSLQDEANGVTVAMAEKKTMNFISDKQAAYRRLMAEGKTKEAYYALGEALHAIMDSTSPSHKGYQVFDDSTVQSVLEHRRKETKKVYDSNKAYDKEAVGAVMGVYNGAIQ
jgi:RHS repeat-associated protein